MHHVYLDDEKDPHSPHQIGFLRSLTHRWDVPFENIPLRFTKGLLRLETPKWYHNNSFFPFIFFTIFIWAVTVAYGTSIYGFAELGYYMINIFSYDGPAVWLQTWGLEFAWAGFAGVALGQWSMGITNAWQHSDKRGKGYIRNVPWYLSFINWGEGSHDYHHTNPRDYSFGKGLNDPSQYFIIFLEKIGALSINRNI
jgi:fatty-acid desaturase